MFRGFIGVVLTVLVLGVSFAASASGFDLFGVQAQGIAEVSARTAAARDGSASYYNPGGLALGQGYEVDLSALGVMSQLEVQDRSYAIDEPWGATVTVAAAVPLQGPLANRIRLGLALQGFGNTLMKLKLREASRPFFPYYDNRTQRLVVIPALSVRLAEGVGLGLGINTLAGMQGPIDVREGQSRMMEARVVQEAGTVARMKRDAEGTKCPKCGGRAMAGSPFSGRARCLSWCRIGSSKATGPATPCLPTG